MFGGQAREKNKQTVTLALAFQQPPSEGLGPQIPKPEVPIPVLILWHLGKVSFISYIFRYVDTSTMGPNVTCMCPEGPGEGFFTAHGLQTTAAGAKIPGTACSCPLGPGEVIWVLQLNESCQQHYRSRYQLSSRTFRMSPLCSTTSSLQLLVPQASASPMLITVVCKEDPISSCGSRTVTTGATGPDISLNHPESSGEGLFYIPWVHIHSC